MAIRYILLGRGGYRPLPHGEINDKKGRNRGKCEKYVARGKSNEKYHMKKICLGKKNNFRPPKN
jgi:hypothetical protein